MEAMNGQGAMEELIRGGTTIGLLVPALVIVVRTLKEQYESRIASLEKRTEECERDRSQLNSQVQGIWRELYERKHCCERIEDQH